MRLHKASMDKSWCAYKPVRSKAIPVLGIGFAVIIFCLTPALADAATDSFSIQEAAGITTSNYPVQMGRPFVQGEIENYPQVGICSDASCGTISQWLTTQADVKQHWTDGSVKHAVLSFYIPKLTAHSTVHFKVQNQTDCNCGTGLTQAQMLASNYNFDATEIYTNGVSATVSAREILSAWDGSSQGVTGPVYYWAKGVNATTLIIADYRNNQTCNGHACSSNDFGSDANKSLRPEFHVTFWPLTNQVKVRFVGEIVNTEAMQEQSYDLSLSIGNSSATTVFSQAALKHYPGERWTVSRNGQPGQTWTVTTPSGSITIPKETWINGVPAPIAINHNLAYIENTFFTPNYDTSLVIPESQISSDWNLWAQSNPYSLWSTGAFWATRMGNAGASPWIGPVPFWTSSWLYSGDIRYQEIALHSRELQGAFGEHLMEGHPGNNLNRTDPPGTGTAIGHILSITSRKGFNSTPEYWSYVYYNSSDVISPVGNQMLYDPVWIPDSEHQPDFGSVEYALTGEYYFLQEQFYSGSFQAAATYPSIAAAGGRGPTGAEGGFYDDDPRGIAWELRAVMMAAFIAPENDFAPEQTYFSTLTNDFIAIEEGARCGANDLYQWCASSPFHKNPNWIWGYTTRANVNTGGNQGSNYPVLHQWATGNSAFTQGGVDGQPSTYGIQFVVGNGTISNTSRSANVAFSSTAQCSQLHIGQVLDLAQDGDVGAGRLVTIQSLACPSATISDALLLTQGGGNWIYAPVPESAISQFSSDYLLYVLGRGQELGFKTDNLVAWLGQFFIGLVNDSNSNPFLSFVGRMPTVDVRTGSSFTTYGELKQAFETEWQNLSSGWEPNWGPGINYNSPPIAYPALARTAYSMIYSQPGGATAWKFFAGNVDSDVADFSTNPVWALLPRTSSVTPVVPVPSMTANKCDVNSDGSVNVLDVQMGIDKALGTSPCSFSACNSSAVSAITTAVLSGNCTLQ